MLGDSNWAAFKQLTLRRLRNGGTTALQTGPEPGDAQQDGFSNHGVNSQVNGTSATVGDVANRDATNGDGATYASGPVALFSTAG